MSSLVYDMLISSNSLWPTLFALRRFTKRLPFNGPLQIRNTNYEWDLESPDSAHGCQRIPPKVVQRNGGIIEIILLLLKKIRNKIKLKIALNFIVERWSTWQRRNWIQASIQLGLEQKDAAVALRQLQGVFVFWIFGLSSAVLAFTAEICMQFWKTQLKRPQI